MEHTQTPDNQPAPAPEKAHYTAVTLKNRKTIFIALGIAAFLILAALLVMQGFIVAATVNGSPISRISVIKELEKRDGKQALEGVISRQLIDGAAKEKGITVDESEISGEIQTIESDITSRGSTLEDQLAQQGLTREDLKANLSMHLKIEKLLADKAQASDEDVDAFIATNEITLEKGKEAEQKEQIKEQIRENKVNELADQLIADLRDKARIKYYVNY